MGGVLSCSPGGVDLNVVRSREPVNLQGEKATVAETLLNVEIRKLYKINALYIQESENLKS